MEAYLDNSATTRCSKAAADMVYKLLTEDYGNPSSLHMKGVEAENYINDAKKKIAEFPNRMFYRREKLEPVPCPHQLETELSYTLLTSALDDMRKENKELHLMPYAEAITNTRQWHGLLFKG